MSLRLLLVLIRRPRGVALLALGLALSGFFALRTLPVSAIPSVDIPTILVTGTLPGASPETMAALVAAPLEKSLGTIAGVREITATNIEGVTRIVLQFELGRSLGSAARDVQAAISTVRDELPRDMPTPPIYQKINPEDAPAVFLAITSDIQPPERLFDLARQIVVPEIARQPGVGGVLIQGAERSAVRIRTDLEALRAMDLGLGELRQALSEATRNSPKGELRNAASSWAILANDQLSDAAAFRELPVAIRNGRIVRLDQVATVEDGIANERTAGWYNGRRAVFIFAQRAVDANLLETAASVRDALPRLEAMLPGSVDMAIIADRSDSVLPMIHDALLAVALTMLAIAGVVVFALRDRTMALIAVLNVPLSLLGTILVMKWAGFSLNIISLGGLAVSIGLVVDDAIVVVENIQRRRPGCRTALQATLRGTLEVAFTIVAITLALVATLSPLLVLAGPVGAIVAEFALTVTAAVLISGFLALTLTPALVARMAPDEAEPMPEARPPYRRYAESLRWTVTHPVKTLVASALVSLSVIPLWAAIPKSFLPLQDTGVIIGIVSARPDTSVEAMALRVQRVARAIGTDPAVKSVSTYLGSGEGTVASVGRIYIALEPVSEGRDAMPRVIERLRGRLADIAGIDTLLQPVEDMRVGGREGVSANQLTLRAERAEELARWLPQVVDRLKGLPSIRDVYTDQAAGGGRIRLDVNRDALARLGGTQAQLNDALYSSFGQRQAVFVDRPFDRMPVVLESRAARRAQVDTVAATFISAPDRGEVPLGAVAQAQVDTSPAVITHDRLVPAATISFNTAPGYALGDAMDDIMEATRGLGMPASIKPEFAGNAGEFQMDLFGQPITFLLACLAVYLVLGILYESFLLPLTILSTLPVAALGSLLGLLLFGMELSVVAFMGLLLVAGIMMKNAIILVNFAVQEQRAHGLSAAEAMYRAGTQRFRPILMTSIAALLGALPIALATGLGAAFRQPLGVAVAGGLIVAQGVTLYMTPAIYILLDRLGARILAGARAVARFAQAKAA